MSIFVSRIHISDFFSPKLLRKNIVSVVFLLDLCICDVLEALREDLTRFDMLSGRLEIGRIKLCRFSSPRSKFRIFFAQNAAGKKLRDSFPTSCMYLLFIRNNGADLNPICLVER